MTFVPDLELCLPVDLDVLLALPRYSEIPFLDYSSTSCLLFEIVIEFKFSDLSRQLIFLLFYLSAVLFLYF